MFNKNPEAKVTECGRFLMKDGDRAIMQMLYEHFMAESEDLGDYPDTVHNQFDNMTGSMNL